MNFLATSDDKKSDDRKDAAQYDAELVSRFNGGDETAFLEIMSLHKEKVFVVAFGILHNHADSEEITQDTFIRAYRGLKKFRGDCSLSTWIYRIALNLSRNRYWYWWRRRRNKELPLDSPLNMNSDNSLILADVLSCDQPKPFDHMGLDEFAHAVAVAMNKLNEKQREILILRIIKSMEYEQIASTLGIDIGTVKSRIARARENLRTIMGSATDGIT